MSELAESLLHDERLTGVGGSDVHHVMNEEPYGCARRLAYDKLSVPRDYEDSDRSKRLMSRGKRLEEVVAEQYTAQTFRSARRERIRRMKGFEHRLVHVDRMLVNVANPPEGVPALARTAPAEFKVPGEYAFKRIVADGLPPAYILQGQWAMLVTGARWMAFGVFWADGWELLPFDVTRNAELGKLLAEAVDRFWLLILRAREAQAKGAPLGELELPERLEAGDERCATCPWRRICWGDRIVEILNTVKAKKAEGDGTAEAAPELAEHVGDYLEAKRILGEQEELVERIQTRLKERLGEREVVQVLEHRVYYRASKPSVGLDMDAMRKAMPPEAFEWLFRTYGKPRKQSRALRIY